ncbi:helix-turn-helix transcriptional regulator [Staphylococcus delphini]|uniref:helix-turn-helix domain-containing protein n=1 Tax=Staphylococcus delphini TaxID=53344 RepID=UPI0033652CCF
MDNKDQKLKEEIGRFLKKMRLNKKVSAKTISDLSGYSQGHISGIEKGSKAIPSKQFIESYLKALKDSFDEYNYYVDEIRKISNGKIKPSYLSSNLEDSIYSTMQEISLPYEYSYQDHNDNRQVMIFPTPINDIHFQLNDDTNAKYYKKLRLDITDKINMTKLLDAYIESKIKILKSLEENNEREISSIIKEIEEKYNN